MNIDWKHPDRDKKTGEPRTLDELALEVIIDGIAETKSEAIKYIRRKVPEEGHYQKKLMDYLKKWAAEHGKIAKVWKVAQGMYSHGGISDVNAVIDGVFVAVEVKRPLFGVVSELQQAFIDEIIAAGGLAIAAVYPEDLQPTLEKLEEMTA